MSKNYFEKFPKIRYPLGTKEVETTDLTVRFKIIDKMMKRPDSYYNYYWQDSDRVDIIADKYYGDSRYSWLVQLSGEVWDWIYDLPLTGELFEEYLLQKYDTVSDVNELHSILHHYEDSSGMVIDKNVYMLLGDAQKREISIYEYEFLENENKRNIKLLSKSLLKDVTNELDKRLQDIKNNRRLFISND